MAESEGRQKLA